MPPTIDALRQALRRWHKSDLGRTEVATQLAVVDERLDEDQLADTLFGRGEALRRVLRLAFERMDREGYVTASELLRRQYVLQEPFMLIASDLALGERGFFKRQSQAMETLAAVLADWEAEVQGRLAASPRSGSRSEAMPVDAADVLAPPSPRHNLPYPISTFIGRERDIAALREQLATRRLVSLTGVGGAGKTRLACELALGLVEDFTDGVWLVDLSPIGDDPLVAETVATVLGVKEVPGLPLEEALIRFLAPKHLLLVMDNCEQVLAACGSLLAPLVAACGGLKVLATSRQPLGLPGEWTWAVAGLGLPQPIIAADTGRHTPPEETPAGGIELTALARAEAVRLFVDRAAAVRHDFRLDATNALAVVEICRQLDGIPLAIELAAARTTLLPVAEIERRLADGFRLLEGGRRGRPARQQTLRATIDWSYALLDAEQRGLFRRLSVFRGGWTLAAAEDVCADPDDGAITTDTHLGADQILELMMALVDRSLVVADPLSDEGRCGLLQTLWQYAREKLESEGEAERWRSRHLSYFLQFAEGAVGGLRGREQVDWLERLEREHDNLRAAFDFAVAAGKLEAGLRLGAALRPFWVMHGYWSEGGERLKRVLDAPESAAYPRFRADALYGLAHINFVLGENAAAAALYEESLAIRRRVGDQEGCAASLQALGETLKRQGDHVKAEQMFTESLALRRDLGDNWGVAASLTSLGNLAVDQSQHAAAKAFHEEALEIERGLGDDLSTSNSLNGLGALAYETGDLQTARLLFEESLVSVKRLSHRPRIAIVLGNVALVAAAQGDLPTARKLQREAMALSEALGDRLGVADSLSLLGGIALDEGQYVEAHRIYGESLSHRLALGDPQRIVEVIEAIGWLAALTDRPSRAAQLLGAADGLRAGRNVLDPSEGRQHDEIVGNLRQVLGESAWSARWAEGRALTQDEAVALAFAECADVSAGHLAPGP